MSEKYSPEVLRVFNKYEIDPELPENQDRVTMIYEAYVSGLVAATQQYLHFTSDDQKKLREWMDAQDAKVAGEQKRKHPYYGASGGAYVYTYCPTGLGIVTRVRNDMTGDEIDLTNYEDW